MLVSFYCCIGSWKNWAAFHVMNSDGNKNNYYKETIFKQVVNLLNICILAEYDANHEFKTTGVKSQNSLNI